MSLRKPANALAPADVSALWGWLLAIAAFSAALIVLIPQEYKLSFDFSKYLAIAAGLEAGWGFAEPDGRPAFYRSGYTILLTGLIKIFGRDASIAILVSMIAAALIPATLVIVGKQLNTLWTGVFAAALLISSPNFIVLAPRHLDPIWPALLAIALALLLFGMRARSLWPFVLCALLTVAATTIKEFSLLFALAVTVTLVALGYERRFIVSYLLVVAIGIAAWLATIVIINGELIHPKWFFNYASKTAADFEKQSALHGNLIEYGLYGAKQLFVASAQSGGILRQYAIGIGLSAGAGLIVVLAILRREPGAIVLAVLLAAFVPIAIITSARGMRLMQSLWFQTLCFMALAYCVQAAINAAYVGLRRQPMTIVAPQYWFGLFNGAILALLLPYAWHNDVEAQRLLDEPRYVSAYIHGDTSGSSAITDHSAIGGNRLGIAIQTPCQGVGVALLETQALNAPVISDHRKVLETIRWEAPQYQDLQVVASLRVDPLSATQRRQLAQRPADYVLIDMEHPQALANNRLNLFTRSSLAPLFTDSAPTLILTHRARGLRHLADTSDGFSRSATIKSRWSCRIYRPTGASASLPDKPVVTKNVATYMAWLATERPEAYAELDAWLKTLN